MKEPVRKRPDRYDVSGNVESRYVDAAETVLVNTKGIADLATLQVAEEESLAKAYERLLGEVRSDTPLTCNLLCHIHQCVFGELYVWAGRWRTVWISKPGITWPAPDYIEQNMYALERDVLKRFPAAAINNDEEFLAAVGTIQGEFLTIHPFREGNARTIKLLTDMLAAQTGRPLLAYDETEEGTERYIAAARAAFRKYYGPMVEVARLALQAART